MDINCSEQVWVSYLTYIGQRDNHMYLSLITDAYSKKILGYDLSSSLNTEGALQALKMAISNRTYLELSLIHHLDRRVQYCRDIHQKVLTSNNIKIIMTESYDPYANAISKIIILILKQ